MQDVATTLADLRTQLEAVRNGDFEPEQLEAVLEAAIWLLKFPARPRKLTPSEVRRMQHMRREGFCVTAIARAFGVSWETARRRSKVES